MSIRESERKSLFSFPDPAEYDTIGKSMIAITQSISVNVAEVAKLVFVGVLVMLGAVIFALVMKQKQ